MECVVAPTPQSIGPGSDSGTKSRCLLPIRSLQAFASGVWSQLPGLSCPPDSTSTSEPVLDFSMLIVATFPVTRSPECRWRCMTSLTQEPEPQPRSQILILPKTPRPLELASGQAWRCGCPGICRGLVCVRMVGRVWRLGDQRVRF